MIKKEEETLEKKMSDYFIPSWLNENIFTQTKIPPKAQQICDDILAELDITEDELENIPLSVISQRKKDKNIKLECLVKPVQSGKTSYLIDFGVVKTFTSNKKNVISIIFCDNNLLLTTQTLERIDCDLEKKEEEGLLYRDTDGDKVLEFSSKNKIKRTELDYFCRNGVKVICMCSNITRIKDIDWFFDQVSSKKDFKFEVWVDEADKFMKPLQDYIKKWKRCDNVKKITLMTATPENIFSTLGRINIIPLETTFDSSIYLSFSECAFKIKNEDCKLVDYIKTIMNENPPENGQFWYVPAGTKRSSHYEVRDVLKSFGFVVITINSDGKCYFTDQTLDSKYVFDCFGTKKEEMMSTSLENWLPEFYEKMELKNTKFAITGNFCIGRGITIQTSKLMITHSIYPPKINNKTASYQSQRILCNLKHIPNFKIPVVYCTLKFKKCIEGMEFAAKNLAKKAHESGKTEVDIKDFIKLYKEGRTRSEDEVITEEFDTHEDMKKRIKKIFKGARPHEDKFEKDSQDRYMCNIRKVVKVYTKDEILANKGFGLDNKTKKKNNYRQHVGYDGDKLVFILCYKKQDGTLPSPL